MPPPQKPVDYRQPRRVYEAIRVGNGTVLVEKQLLSDAPDVAKQSLARLRKKWSEALAALPRAVRADMRKLPLFLLYGPKAKGGGRDNGLEYFPKNAPRHHRTLDPRWSNCVVVYCAENYLRISDFWALKALVHEFAHAHHLGQWPEDQPDIYQGWKNAVKRRLYRGVPDAEGRKIVRAYALVNQLEYFAELSCAYFVGCNYRPFNRAELKTYDPAGYALIQKMWGVKDKAESRPSGSGSRGQNPAP